MHLPSIIKKAFVLVTLLVAIQASAQQHSAGINTNNPNPNAVLHIVSSNGNQGLLIPQIGTTQRLSIDISGVENNGLLVYDNDEGQFYYAHSGSWHTLTNDADFDPSNELQTISKSGNTLTLSGNNSSINIGEGTLSTGQFLEWDGTNWVPVFPPSAQQLQFSGNELSLSNDPTSTTIDFSLWDQNASDDFSGDYIDLINQPAIPTLTSELTNDSGFITSPDDADADATNEIQTLTKSGNSIILSVNNSSVNIAEGTPGIGQFLEWDGANWVSATPPTAQELQFAGNILSLSNDPSATTIDFSLWDQNASDDFNGDYNSLINQPAIPTLTSELTNDSGFITSPDDADADATNEIQTITAGAGITVTPTGNDYQVINSLPDQTVTLADGGSGNLTVGGTYPNLTVDVPSLDDADADATNELNTNFLVNGANLEITDAGGTLQVPLSSIDLANENQTVSAGAGININQVGQDFEVVNILPDLTVTLADGGSGNVTIGGTYPNLTVDVPSLDDADADATNEIQMITAGAGITVTPTGNDYQVINSLPDQTVTLADGGSGNVTIGGTYPNLTVDVPSLDDADADATNEIQTITAGAGITVTPTGNDYQVINSLPDQTVTLADGGSGNVTIGGTYPNLTVDVPSLDDADADATNEIQTITAGAGITVTPTGNDYQVINSLPDQTVILADGGSGNVTIGGTYPNLTVDVPSLDDADANPSNEIQTVDQLNLTGTTLNLSLLNDALAPSTVDLSPINTDDQTVDQFNLTGSTLNLSLESDGAAPYTVDLSSFAIADQTGQNGNYLTTDGTNTSWDPLGALAQLDVVTTTEITDNTITGSDLNATVAGNGLIGGGGTPLALNLSGTSGLQITTDQLEMPEIHPGGTTLGGTGLVITSMDLDSKGRVLSATTSVLISDRRLKKEISKIDNTLDKIENLNGYTYYLKSDSLNENLQSGVMAQEIQDVYPHLIIDRPDGYMAVDYQGLIPILLEAIKEQHTIIEGLETKLDLQEGINTSQESRISDMESKMDQLLQLMSVSK